jgi:hypothetical protein
VRNLFYLVAVFISFPLALCAGVAGALLLLLRQLRILAT